MLLIRLLVPVVLIGVLTSAHPAGVPAATVPGKFVDEAVARVAAPTALAFLPDGRMLITSQRGSLYVSNGGTLREILDLSGLICANSERGLLGVAVDPDFTANRFIYLYYTSIRLGCDRGAPDYPVNRVVRYVMRSGDAIDRDRPTILIDNIPSPAGNHNGGDVQFGRDGYLYISVGDGGCDYAGDSGCAGANDAARDAHALLGKILRITRDGGIPADNPFRGSNSVRCNQVGVAQPGRQCQETWATGLRNPYRIGVDHNSGGSRIYINDVGQANWEEVDVGASGADYGWNLREGPCATGSYTDCGAPPAGLTNPLVAYAHNGGTGCHSITGGAFAPHDWPAPFNRSYIFGDFVCGRLFYVAMDANGAARIQPFASGVGRVVSIMVGPGANGKQALYYTTYLDNGNDGEVRRISYTGTMRHLALPAVFR